MATGVNKVYLFIHELFGVFWTKDHVELVTPHIEGMGPKMPGHTYKIARFKDRRWCGPDVSMTQCYEYGLHGVTCNPHVPLNSVLNRNYSAAPHDVFKTPTMVPPNTPKPGASSPHCRWVLPFPNKIHQLRLITIPRANSPFFTGHPHGEQVESDIQNAFSIVQVFEYLPSPDDLPWITENNSALKIDCTPDSATGTVNLHLWAQMEDESSVTDIGAANKHAQIACAALVKLFGTMQLDVASSLGTDNIFQSQPEMPDGIQFVELLTLSERYTLTHPVTLVDGKEPIGRPHSDCVPSTCGSGTNIYGCTPDSD